MRRVHCILLSLLIAVPVFAYEQPVHRLITIASLMLAGQQNDFLDRLGTTSTATYGTGETVTTLAANGADDEDRGIRSLNHFFDPADGIALQVPPVCSALGWARADNWADDGLLNQWSFADARSLVRQAIVGSTPTYRDLGYRDLFTNLGHAVHLVQDMAQPEHTRNDQHLVGSAMPNGACTPGSLYETWTLHHLSGLYPSETFPNAAAYFTGFAMPSFPSYKDYFSNADKKGLADLTNANFVTQDTNYGDEGGWGLLSGRCVTLAEPKITDATRRVEVITETVLNSPTAPGLQQVSIPEFVYSYVVNDLNKGIGAEDAYHTHLSSIDHEIQQISMTDPLNGGEGIYSLSDHSYASRAAILIPRAVEYSAGLINHFFRGKVGVTWAQGASNSWNLTITNQSSEKIGREAHVVAVYKATPQYFNRFTTEDTQVILDDVIAGWVPGFDGLDPGESVTLSGLAVTGLHTGDSLMQFERRIVVISSLGNEPGVVIPVVQGTLGMRVRVDAAPPVVGASLQCSAFNPPGFRTLDIPVGTDTPFAIAPNEECRVLIQHTQQPAIENEGTQTSLHLKVWRGTQVVEDLTAVIDAGDAALGGCHRVATDGHCDRFIQRTGNCVFDKDYQDNTKCTTTMEQWDWGTGPY